MKPRHQAIIYLREQGLTYKKIGKRFNLSRERIRQILKKYGENKKIPKFCSHCEKEVSKFAFNSSKKWGRICPDCYDKKKKKKRKYDWSCDHPCCLDCGTTKKTTVTKGLCPACYSRFRYKTSPKYRLIIKISSKKWRDKNLERHKAKQKEYREDNKEYFNEYAKYRYWQNRDRARLIAKKCYYKKRLRLGKYVPDEIKKEFNF